MTVLYSGINGACLQYKIKRMSDCQDKDSAGSGAEAKGAEATSATETIPVASDGHACPRREEGVALG